MRRHNQKYLCIGSYLQLLGIPVSMTGYVYICDAVYLILEDFDMLYSATKKIYPIIAELNGVSSSSVQKCISNAVRAACKDPNDKMKQVFENYLKEGRRKSIYPTEFIGKVYWNILLEIQRMN